MRHVLTNVVGARDETDVEVGERVLQSGEMLLLCSDGLHGTLDDEMMQEIVTAGADVAEIAENLIAAALDRNASDNVTALLVRYASDPAEYVPGQVNGWSAAGSPRPGARGRTRPACRDASSREERRSSDDPDRQPSAA